MSKDKGLNNEKPEKYSLSLRIPEEIRQSLFELAEEEGRSVSNLATKIITDFIKKHKARES